MVIHAIWVRNAGNLENVLFNLSGQYLFKLSSDARVLTIERNPRYIPGFWKHKNVASVAAIVGENGAGKTNILDWIFSTLPRSDQPPPNRMHEYLVAVEKDGASHVFYQFAGEGVITINSPDGEGQWESTALHDVARPSSQFPEFFHKDVSFIYYSNDLAPLMRTRDSDLLKSGPETHNISTAYCMRHDALRLRNGPSGSISQVEAHATMEVLRNIEFILEEGSERFCPFNFPSCLYIEPERIPTEFLQPSQHYAENGKPGFVFRLTLAALVSLFRDTNPQKGDPPFGRLHESLSGDYSLESMRNEIVKMGRPYGAVGEKRLEFLDFVAKRVPGDVFAWNGERAEFTTDAQKLSVLREFFGTYAASVAITPFVSCRWRHRLSGGEQSILTLFSRIWSVCRDKPARNMRVGKHVVLLLDEADICFHPEWQKRLFDLLLEFTARMAFRDSEIQILMTSNSPFCVSDIPRDNVILLERDKSSYVSKVADTGCLGETFGANIHSLLAKSFFMKQSLMGDFARHQIRDLVQWLTEDQNENAAEWINEETALVAIDLIGEPLLRERMRDLYRRHAGDTDSEIARKRRLERLRAELAELEAREQENGSEPLQ
ncbi:MAG TPA: hypothetical protein VGP72_05320 [Planctomycetota bacterium]|jgi:hypothetical protein